MVASIYIAYNGVRLSRIQMLLRIVRAVRLNLRYAEEDTLHIRLSEAD